MKQPLKLSKNIYFFVYLASKIQNWPKGLVKLSKFRVWEGVGIVGNQVVNFRKNGVGGTTIRDERVMNGGWGPNKLWGYMREHTHTHARVYYAPESK